MAWQELSFIIDDTAYTAISELLEKNGALSVSLTDARDQPLYEPLPNTMPLWYATRLTALFDANFELTPLIAILNLFGFYEIEVTPLADQAWERVCLDQFTPQKFGKNLWICPSWHTVDDLNTHAIIVKLDPGLAFGTGSHPTTRLCLTWLATHDCTDKVIVDYGCGSGILAIAAAKCGAKSVYAIDIDPQALTATRSNMADNAISNCHVLLPQGLPPGLQADIVVANILSETLIALAPTLTALLKPGGQLVCSGILADQKLAVQQAYQNDYHVIDTVQQAEWLLLAATKLTSHGKL